MEPPSDFFCWPSESAIRSNEEETLQVKITIPVQAAMRSKLSNINSTSYSWDVGENSGLVQGNAYAPRQKRFAGRPPSLLTIRGDYSADCNSLRNC